jgi:DNA-binding NarL/FixJ family response regulator
LFGTEATVNIRVGNVMLKLGPRDRVQAAVVAHEHGIAVARDRGPDRGGAAALLG